MKNKSTSAKKISEKEQSVTKFPNAKKNWSVAEKIFGFIELARPVEWSKPLLNMTLAALIAFYIYNSSLSPFLFLAGFFSVAFLWSGLYALNDYTDRKIDALHKIKKNRPIPSGKVSPFQGLIFSVVLVVSSFLIAFLLGNFLLILCLLCMLTNQFFYTLPPFRLKARKYFDLISGSMVNPLFRYLSGLVLFVSFYRLITNPLPLLPIIFVIGIQFSGYSLYRMFSVKHDKKIKLQSSVALLGQAKIKALSYSAMGIGALAYLLLLINGSTFQLKFLGYLPVQYVLPVAGALITAPLLKDAVINPQKADMKKSYRITYYATILFIILNWIVFFFLR